MTGDDELHALLLTVITRLMKMLMRRGVLIEEKGQTYLAEPDADGDEARTLRLLHSIPGARPVQLTRTSTSIPANASAAPA